MDNDGHFIKIDFTEEKHFGYYSLIETGLVAKYSNKRITSIEELEKYNEKLKKDKVRDEMFNFVSPTMLLMHDHWESCGTRMPYASGGETETDVVHQSI